METIFNQRSSRNGPGGQRTPRCLEKKISISMAAALCVLTAFIGVCSSPPSAKASRLSAHTSPESNEESNPSSLLISAPLDQYVPVSPYDFGFLKGFSTVDNNPKRGWWTLTSLMRDAALSPSLPSPLPSSTDASLSDFSSSSPAQALTVRRYALWKYGQASVPNWELYRADPSFRDLEWLRTHPEVAIYGWSEGVIDTVLCPTCGYMTDAVTWDAMDQQVMGLYNESIAAANIDGTLGHEEEKRKKRGGRSINARLQIILEIGEGSTNGLPLCPSSSSSVRFPSPSHQPFNNEDDSSFSSLSRVDWLEKHLAKGLISQDHNGKEKDHGSYALERRALLKALATYQNSKRKVQPEEEEEKEDTMPNGAATKKASASASYCTPSAIGPDLYLAFTYRWARAAVHRYSQWDVRQRGNATETTSGHKASLSSVTSSSSSFPPLPPIIIYYQLENELNEAFLASVEGQRPLDGYWANWTFLTQVLSVMQMAVKDEEAALMRTMPIIAPTPRANNGHKPSQRTSSSSSSSPPIPSFLTTTNLHTDVPRCIHTLLGLEGYYEDAARLWRGGGNGSRAQTHDTSLSLLSMLNPSSTTTATASPSLSPPPPLVDVLSIDAYPNMYVASPQGASVVGERLAKTNKAMLMAAAIAATASAEGLVRREKEAAGAEEGRGIRQQSKSGSPPPPPAFVMETGYPYFNEEAAAQYQIAPPPIFQFNSSQLQAFAYSAPSAVASATHAFANRRRGDVHSVSLSSSGAGGLLYFKGTPAAGMAPPTPDGVYTPADVRMFEAIKSFLTSENLTAFVFDYVLNPLDNFANLNQLMHRGGQFMSRPTAGWGLLYPNGTAAREGFDALAEGFAAVP